MVPQNGQLRPQHQQPALPSFMAPNPPFDPSPYFNNLDPTQAAKQMAALSAASQARIANTANTRPNPPGGTNSAPFVGGITSPTYTGPNYDSPSGSSAAHATFQLPNNQSLPPTSNLSSFPDSSMAHQNPASRNPPQPNSTTLKQRQQGFLNGLANVMANRGTPLPPAITGISSPNYDPNTSQWKSLEPSSEVGFFRLAGRDINLFKLWGSVFQSGGGHAVSTNNGWSAIAAQFGLPDEIPQQPPNVGTIPVPQTIAHYYMAMLYPFEHYYKTNMQEQQKRVLAASRQGGPQGQQPADLSQARYLQGFPGGMQPTQLQRGATGPPSGSATQVHGAPSTVNGSSQFPQVSSPRPPHQRPSSTAPSHSAGGPSHNVTGHDSQANTHSSDVNVLDQDMHGVKRKIEADERDTKRVRQKTESEPPEGNPSGITTAVDRGSSITTSNAPSTISAPPRSRPQPSRRKIEYVPLAREVETYGGRDLKFLDTEIGNMPQRRPIRDINDWGTVDIEALTMSIRSRISTELSYALTTFTLLSTMRGQTPGSGFPVIQAADLFDEVLDLLEEQAFGETEDTTDVDSPLVESPIVTHRELVNTVYESGSNPFAALTPHQGSKDPDIGPRQRPGNIVLAIMNIIRNLSTIPDNVEYISRHTRLIDLILRLSTVTQGQHGAVAPASPALSLGDLINVRKDTLYTLTNVASNVNLSTSSPSMTFRMASRAFQLVSSYLVDPIEAISPSACVHPGIPLGGNTKPPLLADVALDVFSRLGQADSNRKILAQSVHHSSLLRLFEALVHRLPVVEADFQIVARDVWLSYLEKNIMAIYSLAFLAPPVVKQKVKANRALGFKTIMLAMVQRFLMMPSPEGRAWFLVCTRRAIEAMKVLDDAEDSFDMSKLAVPTMAFGMGYGDVGDSSAERGTGLLGGHRDVAWELLMVREVYGDEVMFNELESLARVEC